MAFYYFFKKCKMVVFSFPQYYNALFTSCGLPPEREDD
ncbi:hypothetical protein Patl1_21647 [Pistacia atlantica]|uniref:Uncharacterized protein n=1 Tax=Pistacia atlantica TaxID=434234 RepID=A0ACC1BHQ2_9ROSI|nr:hypothetical protein Patl1_21647 [Pistacia atlantica]